MLKTKDNKFKIKPYELQGFILNEYGIGCDVVIIEEKPIIKIYNHFALFSIIQEVRRNFDFTVHHKFEKNEFIIILGNKF